MVTQADGWTLEHLALAASGMGAWDYDVHTDRITWSERLHQIYGIPVGSFDGTFSSFEALIHPVDRPAVIAEIRRALETGPDEFEVEHRIVSSSHERWVLGRGRVFRDEQGRPVRMAGVAQDITERHAYDREQRDVAALMRAALDASVFAVVVLTPEGRIIYSNELAAELLGLTRSAVESRTYDAPQWKHTDVDGGPWPVENQPFVRVMATGSPVSGVEHAIERPDGRRTILRINGAPVKDELGEIKLLVFSFEDVTQRRAMEDGLRQAQKMEAIGRLAGGVAHDFNNLLTAILSFAALARREVRDSKLALDHLDGITAAAERAATLTRQLLAFSRRDVSRPVVFDARKHVTDSARILERLVGDHVSLEVDVGEDPCLVKLDPGQLQQILMNLAVNARDAMPNGGKLLLEVRCTRSDDAAMVAAGATDATPPNAWVRIAVSDQGTGMDEATRRRAFEPFFTTKPQHEGTGLGLSTSHGIVVQAGGHIGIESELGRGTRVIIHLPLAEAAPSPAATPSSSSALPSVARRVLLIEDDPAVRTVATRGLRALGFEVVAAKDGDEALAFGRAERFDAVVCDVVLPGANGFEIVTRLRENQPDLRALFVSGYSAELAARSDTPYLAKPYTPDALAARVRELIEGRG